MLLDPRWFIVAIMAGITFGLISPVVTARKMMFLAAAMPHSALLAAVLGIPLAVLLGESPGFWAIVIGTPLPLLIYLLERKGVAGDVSTSVYVAGSASTSVALMYYVLTHYSLKTSLWSYILGDPLLSTWEDVYIALIIALMVILVLAPFLREQILIGVDRDFALSSGIRVEAYDIVFLLLLSASTVGFMKIIGYVLEHVLILLPSSIALALSRSGREVVLASLLTAMVSTVIGLLVGLWVNVQVSASIGFVLLGFYIGSLAFNR